MNADTLVPLPPALSAYTWRPARPDDAPAIQRMMVAAGEADRAESVPSDERIRQLLAMLGSQIDTNTLLAVAADGTIAARAMIFIPPAEGERVAMTDGTVHVDHRGRGIGSYVLQWIEARVRQEFSRSATGTPATIRASCAGHQADRIALLEQHGFAAVRHSYKMQRPLPQPVPQRPLPNGLRSVQWTPALDIPLVDAFNAAFGGQWGVQRMNHESWRQSFTGVPQFRADLTYLAMDGDTIAGFCVNWVNEAGNPDLSAREGWIEAIGVIPAWRGRGIASILLDNALHLFQSEGLTRAALDVDAENPTGAVRLYERHGFTVAKETVLFVKEIP